MNMSQLDAESTGADALPRMHTLLVEAVRRRRGIDPHQVPVTVAEIYQDLVPYRTARETLGVEMNADYEYLLLRLLAGEQQLARLEPAAARDQIAQELESPNPNVALYRKFAACDVWLMPSAAVAAPAWLTDHLEEEDALAGEPELELEDAIVELDWEAEETTPAPSVRAQPAHTFTVAEDAVEAEPIEEGEAESEPAAAGTRSERAAGEARCAFCDSALPRGRQARYCPYCGADQRLRPCGSCGEAIEPGWAFCIACGHPAADVSA